MLRPFIGRPLQRPAGGETACATGSPPRQKKLARFDAERPAAVQVRRAALMAVW
jgi:hypothetical protein